jgi:threonine/homoserine/homoserine lactone efflux protein
MKNLYKNAKIFKNGLATGLILQLAIGPVFFYIMNLVLQKTILDGFVGVIAVVIVDFFYITLAILGLGEFLKNEKTKRIFGIISSLALMIFGALLISNVIGGNLSTENTLESSNLASSFTSVFLLTISSPITSLFFTSIFTAKTLEYKYSKRELFTFGFGTGFATLLFMGISVVLFSLINKVVPMIVVQMLNGIVGCLLIGYGGLRLAKSTAK